MTGLEIVGALMTVGSTVMSAMAASQQADAQKKAADYNRAIEERNAKILRQQAESDMEDKRTKNNEQLGAMRAAYGASGLAMSGTPLDVLADSATTGEYDAQKIKYKGDLQALGHSDKANLYAMEADSAEASKGIGVLGAIFKGGSSLMSNTGVKSLFG